MMIYCCKEMGSHYPVTCKVGPMIDDNKPKLVDILYNLSGFDCIVEEYIIYFYFCAWYVRVF